MTRSKARAAALSLSSLLVALSFVGCPLLKKRQGDAGADAAEEATTVDASRLGAKNEASVLRYAHETPLPNEPAVIGAEGAHVRNFPGNGPEVVFLAKGTPVTKIAQYFATGTLVVFDDPQKDGTKLMGWVVPTAFAAAASPTKPILPYTVVKVADAGAATSKDAGAPHDGGGSAPPAVVDAGKPVIVDAGGGGGSNANGTIPQPPKGAVAVPPTNGKCPDGWALDQMCRRKCTADAECPRGTKCLLKGAQKVCTSG